MTQNPKPQSSTYLAYYGLQREPFGQSIEDDLYFADATRKQRLDILLHLTQYGHELMLVIGPEGCGKTTLLQQFQLKALSSWAIAFINAQNGLDERILMQQLFHQMDMNFNGPTHAELTEQMTHHFEALLRSARQAVLIIDDAEHLTVTALKRVLEMAAMVNKENKPLLRVILVGTQELTSKLDDPLLAQLSSIPQRRIELSPFDQENTTHYILHRLSVAQFSATEPFTDANLHKLFKQSGGVPGRINELAHKLLMDTLPAKAHANQNDIEGLSTFKPMRTLVAALVSTIILALIIFQDEVNQWFHPQQIITTELAIPEVSPPAPEEQSVANHTQAPTAQLAATDSGGTPREESSDTRPAVSLESAMDAIVTSGLEPAISAETAPHDESTLSTINTQASTAEKTESTESREEPEPSNNAAEEPTQPSTASTIASDIASNTTTNITAVTESNPQQNSASKPAATSVAAMANVDNLPEQRGAWLRQQNPGHYTLQLVAGENLNTIHKFIREHQLDTGHLALYQSTRNGKPWYGLTYGIYPNKQEAIDARSRLSPDLRKLTPWVRDLGGIQATLP